MERFLRYADIASVSLFVLGLPLVIFVGFVLQNWQPDPLFYSALSGRLFNIPLCLPSLIFMGLFWFSVRLITRFLKSCGKIVRRVGWTIIVAAILLADLLSFQVALASPRKFDVGDPYCDMAELGALERCEGTDIGFLQDSLSALIRFGASPADIIKKIETFPDYDLYQTDCATLPGAFGETCYAGQYQRVTGDVSYLNIYLHKDKTLILESENIVINDSKKYSPMFLPGHEPKLEDFVRIERFQKDMTE